MAKTSSEKQTVIILPDRGGDATISCFSPKWVNRLTALEEQGVAREVETSIEGAREWEVSREAIKLPHYRQPREYTEEQREAARTRLAGVREAVKAAKEEAAAEAAKAAAKKGKNGKKSTAVEDEPAPAKPTSKVAAATGKGKPAPKAEPEPAPKAGKVATGKTSKKAEPEPVVVQKPVVAKTGKSKDVVKADSVPAPKGKGKKAAQVEMEDELDEEDELEELEDDDEELEEVIVKRPSGRGGKKAG